MDPRTLLGSVDIRETDKDYQFIVDVPGLTKEDVKVRVSGDNILTIEGERKVRADFLVAQMNSYLAAAHFEHQLNPHQAAGTGCMSDHLYCLIWLAWFNLQSWIFRQHEVTGMHCYILPCIVKFCHARHQVAQVS